MDKTLCARCQNTFHTVAPDNALPCPFCGFVSKDDEIGKREDKRILIQRRCDLAKGSILLRGNTVDISKSGVGIEMSGDIPFTSDEIIDVLVADLELNNKARLVWAKKHENNFRAGFIFTGS